MFTFIQRWVLFLSERTACMEESRTLIKFLLFKIFLKGIFLFVNFSDSFSCKNCSFLFLCFSILIVKINLILFQEFICWLNFIVFLFFNFVVKLIISDLLQPMRQIFHIAVINGNSFSFPFLELFSFI